MSRIPSRDLREPDPTPWGLATSAVLRTAGVRQTVVAEKIGGQKAFLNRFLVGHRRPTAETVRCINRVVADLTGYPRIKDYLDFEAAASDLLEDEDAEGALAAAAIRCLRWYGSFFTTGAIEAIDNRIRALSKRERRKLLVALNRAFRRIALFELLPSSKLAGFDDVCTALSEAGMPIEDFAGEDHKMQLAHERFAQTVLQVLADQNPDGTPGERLAAMRRILEAASPLALAAYEFKMDAASEGLRESVSFENGKRVSRFYGDSRAAFAAFSNPARVVKATAPPSSRRKKGPK